MSSGCECMQELLDTSNVDFIDRSGFLSVVLVCVWLAPARADVDAAVRAALRAGIVVGPPGPVAVSSRCCPRCSPGPSADRTRCTCRPTGGTCRRRSSRRRYCSGTALARCRGPAGKRARHCAAPDRGCRSAQNIHPGSNHLRMCNARSRGGRRRSELGPISRSGLSVGQCVICATPGKAVGRPGRQVGLS